MSDPVQQILAALREHGHQPKRAGEGWIASVLATKPTNESGAPSKADRPIAGPA